MNTAQKIRTDIDSDFAQAPFRECKTFWYFVDLVFGTE